MTPSAPVGTLIASALTVVACGAPPPSAPAASAPAPAAAVEAVPPPPVSINATMVSLIDHAGHALWDAEKPNQAPKSDARWADIEHHAVQLAAAGSLVRLGGQGTNDLVWSQSPNWQKWARALSDAGLAAEKATRAKSMEGLVAANGQLVEACEGCHKEFKPDLPSEGIAHTHAH